ncbi:terpene synthase family protein [Streptomyces sp. NPDC003077]|uniref:terpene synthase family protein n=1 Tax=Streptomyces sp. NPDC003077 TaxID=3154443 RepID=UPI0033B40D9F
MSSGCAASSAVQQVELRLNDTKLPIAVRHPDYERLHADYADWYDEQAALLGGGAAFETSNLGDRTNLTARLFPYPSYARLKDVSVFLSTAAWFDDAFDDASSEVLSSYVAVARQEQAPDATAELRLWDNCMTQAREALPVRLWGRVADGIADWLGCIAQPPEEKKFGDLEEYLSWRRPDLAFGCWAALVEHSVGGNLSRLTGTDELERFHTACFEFAALVNDLVSYRKELLEGDEVNAIAVLRRGGADLQEAVDMVCERINRAESAFWDLGRDLRARWPGAEDVPAFLEAWKYNLGGYLSWCLHSPRYHGEGYYWDGSLPTRMALPVTT